MKSKGLDFSSVSTRDSAAACLVEGVPHFGFPSLSSLEGWNMGHLVGGGMEYGTTCRTQHDPRHQEFLQNERINQSSIRQNY